MGFSSLPRQARRLQLAVWAAGLVALIGALAYGHIASAPYFATWAWLSYIGMLVCEDALTALKAPAWRPLPRVTLLAAIIVFRKHPEVVVLVALAGGAAAGLIRRQPWYEQVSVTASWILMAVAGAAAFRLIGYADSPHFIAATVVLVLLFTAIDCRTDRSWKAVGRSLALGTCGALLALAWRTPGPIAPIVLRSGEVALLAAGGLLLGALLGNRPPSMSLRAGRHQVPGLVMAGLALLLISAIIPNRASWIAASLGLLALLTWSARRRLFGPVVMLLGGLCNEIVRGANGGRMPVDLMTLSPALRAEFAPVARGSVTYAVADSHTALRFLADRFPAGPFTGIASLGDLLIAAGLLWWFAGTPGLSRRLTEPADEPAIAA